MKNSDFNNQLIHDIKILGFRRWLVSELTVAFYEARKNKIKTFNEHSYEVNWQENIIKLADAILNCSYRPSPSVSFIIYEPMIREIFAAPFVDRVVHHLLFNLSGWWWDRRFIYDSYSCRELKGTLFGIERIQKMMRCATYGGTKDAFILKNDIKGYFMSLPRLKCYERVVWGLDRQFGPVQFGTMSNIPPELRKVYETCRFLWHEILMDDPAAKSRRRGPLSNWDDLPFSKSLYNRLPGEGIVIGNQTSQLVSNIYLDQLDRFIKYDLGYKYYGRYVDDFIRIVGPDDYRKALSDAPIIRDYLDQALNLTLHPDKYYVQSVYRGVSFLGARVYPYALRPSNRLQAKFRRAVKDFTRTGGKDANKRATFISYLGLLRHLQADKFVAEVFDQYGLDFNLYLESKLIDHRCFEEILDDLADNLNSNDDDDSELSAQIVRR
ncbi:RNA-directed DNA polymerase [Candidatus Saccharibacteria bacterium]|nr:RNA-directed DNA polymerase [Candidatus Saccharibacteria bacterium]